MIVLLYCTQSALLSRRPNAPPGSLPLPPNPKVPTVDTNLVQSLINILECQLEQAFEAVQGGGGGGRKQSMSKRKGSTAGAGAEGGAPLDPKV